MQFPRHVCLIADGLRLIREESDNGIPKLSSYFTLLLLLLPAMTLLMTDTASCRPI